MIVCCTNPSTQHPTHLDPPSLLHADDAAKLSWLKERLPGFIDDGDVLCFVGQRAKAEEVTQSLNDAGFRAAAIHGDMDQVRVLVCVLWLLVSCECKFLDGEC